MRAEYRSGTLFAVGALIPLVVMLIGFPVVGALGLWVGQPLIAPVRWRINPPDTRASYTTGTWVVFILRAPSRATARIPALRPTSSGGGKSSKYTAEA